MKAFTPSWVYMQRVYKHCAGHGLHSKDDLNQFKGQSMISSHCLQRISIQAFFFFINIPHIMLYLKFLTPKQLMQYFLLQIPWIKVKIFNHILMFFLMWCATESKWQNKFIIVHKSRMPFHFSKLTLYLRGARFEKSNLNRAVKCLFH